MKNAVTSMASALGMNIARRSALALIAAASTIPFTATMIRAQITQGTPTSTPAELIGDVVTPSWRFTVVDFQDPYTGKLTKPGGVPDGTRIVSSEVILSNDSDQPMQFTITDIRLHDTEGFQYRAGDFLGTEPQIVSQNISSGQRLHGWVWFGIPISATPSSLILEAPRPILTVDLS
jgi:hypothetical protein